MNLHQPYRFSEADGPYLLWESDTRLRQIEVAQAESGYRLEEREAAADALFTCRPTSAPAFSFRLQTQHAIPPLRYPLPDKLLCLSDIEGNFEALRALLLGNGVMDENYDWTFGKNHLLLLGDLMDRASDVLPVLWLAYKLEYEAAASGGCVHVLLGNHELMNLLGELHYLNPKYQQLAQALSENRAGWEATYRALFSQQSELGRWLACKNTVEQLGPYLFAHAGISAGMLRYSPEEMNEGVRALMAGNLAQAYRSPFYGAQGPLWYRGYGIYDSAYEARTRERELELDRVLAQYQARRLIIGHNLVPLIGTSLGGKLLSIDVHQQPGRYQALLIEGDRLFRLNEAGRREQLA